jgi:hypothetical protein
LSGEVVAKPSPMRAGPHRLGPEARHQHRRRLVREVVDACVLDGVVAAAVAVLAARPQRAHDLDGLLEHLQAHVGLGPVRAEDVLVERLAAADPEVEAALEQHGAGRRRLGDHRRVDANGRARHARGHRQARGL